MSVGEFFVIDGKGYSDYQSIIIRLLEKTAALETRMSKLDDSASTEQPAETPGDGGMEMVSVPRKFIELLFSSLEETNLKLTKLAIEVIEKPKGATA